MTNVADEILALWERIANELVFLEKRYVFYHGELSLHPSELHVLHRNPPGQANTTRLALRLGITKDACRK